MEYISVKKRLNNRSLLGKHLKMKLDKPTKKQRNKTM